MANYLLISDIRARIQDFINDSDAGVQTIIDRCIDLADRKIRHIDPLRPLRWLTHYDVFNTAASTRSYALAPSGYTVGRVLQVKVANDPCILLASEQLEKDDDTLPFTVESAWTDTKTGQPLACWHEQTFNVATPYAVTNKLHFFLMPNAVYAVRYWFEQAYTLLAAAEVPPIPPEFHEIYIWRAMMFLQGFDVEIKDGVDYFAFYRELERDLIAFNRAQYGLVRRNGKDYLGV